MKKNSLLKPFLICICAVCVLAVLTVSCGKKAGDDDVPTGEVAFTLEVIGPDGYDKSYEITTVERNLRKVLESEGLIAGDDSAYGLYIKVVDGITADYDKDGAYWALSKDGQMTPSGVDGIVIAGGEHYELTYTK